MCHVLIIEDEPMIAMLLQDLLEEAGATSFAFAATEQDAVTLAVQHPPRVITSDIHLLEGTGPRAVAEIKSGWAAFRPCSSPPTLTLATNAVRPMPS